MPRKVLFSAGPPSTAKANPFLDNSMVTLNLIDVPELGNASIAKLKEAGIESVEDLLIKYLAYTSPVTALEKMQKYYPFFISQFDRLEREQGRDFVPLLGG